MTVSEENGTLYPDGNVEFQENHYAWMSPCYFCQFIAIVYVDETILNTDLERWVKCKFMTMIAYGSRVIPKVRFEIIHI